MHVMTVKLPTVLITKHQSITKLSKLQKINVDIKKETTGYYKTLLSSLLL